MSVPIVEDRRPVDRRGRRIAVIVAVVVVLWTAGVVFAFVHGVGGKGDGMSGMDMGAGPSGGMDMSPSAEGQPRTARTAGAGPADVTFAMAIVPHTRQALALAGLVADRSDRADVKALAQEIRTTSPDVAPVEGWLSSWGTDAAAGPSEHTAGMGMLDDAAIAGLAEARGPQFDRLFLDAMLLHHQGAVTMAQVELAGGSFEPAQALARSIVGVDQMQVAEIERLRSAAG